MAENIPPLKHSASPSGSLTRKRALHGRSIRSAQEEVTTRAVDRREPSRLDVALEHARIAARIADENRAKDILLLDLRQATPLLDFFVIATASSRRQGHAIASEIDAQMKKLGEHKLGLEGSEEGRWILIDYGDFVVHIFSAECRSYYALEEIWGDAPRLSWSSDQPRLAGPTDTSCPS
ncbi:MAG: ribosome silencing factor [Planctomycetaceae bacterium]|nr:ribosome silencing factor [Planctomycetaceae bacterium]